MPLDDAWIHFIYARSLGTTLRLDYNPGQSETGFTSMLWVVLLAPFMLLRIPPPIAAKILGLAALVGLAWYLYLLLKRYFPRFVAAGAALIVTTAPVMTYSALSGMEVTVYAMCMAAAAFYFIESRYKACAGFCAATALARPDGLVFVVLLWFVFLLERVVAKLRPSGSRNPSANDAAFLFSVPVLAALGWMTFCFAATGRPLTSSYYIRAGGLDFFMNLGKIDTILYEISVTAFTLDHWSKALLLIAGVAFFVVKKEFKAMLFVLFAFVFPVLMGGKAVQVIGGTFMGNRYIVPALPFLLFMQAAGIGTVVIVAGNYIKSRATAKIILPVIAVCLFMLLLLPPGKLIKHWQDMRGEFAMGCSNIEEMQVQIGHWINSNTAKDAVVATFDAGAIRYIGNRKTIDILALNTHDIPPSDPIVIRKQADYLVTYPSHQPDLVEPYIDKEIFRVKLQKNIVCAADTMVVYRVK